ncbi:hypothetical protein, partial [Chitinophaga sp. GbtcB8]|uniref:hypothetical protein n=1 Tax=Chitinophaga sp. GbtcB8 TaxID=2824753 RepID=UPI001C30BAEC
FVTTIDIIFVISAITIYSPPQKDLHLIHEQLPYQQMLHSQHLQSRMHLEAAVEPDDSMANLLDEPENSGPRSDLPEIVGVGYI